MFEEIFSKMKNYLLAATAALALLASCTKEYTTVNVSGEPARPAFRVSGITDVTFEKTPFGNLAMAYMPLQVTYVHGESQRVNLELSGMPQGIRDSLQIASGYPDFNTSALFFYENAPNGSYPVKLSAKADTGKTQEYNFQIKVTGDTSCSGYLTNATYRTSSFCTGSGAQYTTTLSKNGAAGDTMYVNNLENTNLALKCLITCRSSQITIPNQIVGNSTYSGSGYLNGGPTAGTTISMYIYKTDNATRVTTSCSYSLSRN
jgi:hypothetical protein